MAMKSLLRRIIDYLPFRSRIRDLVLGTQMPLVEVQLLLAQLGYLTGAYQPGQLDDLTRRALILFQKFYKLDLITGELTNETVEALKAPRCGNPDLHERSPIHDLDLIAFDSFTPMRLVPDLSRGCSYQGVTTLTYFIVNQPARGGLNSDQVKNIIEVAFKTWEDKIPIKFEPALTIDSATFKLMWAGGDHGDGREFIFDDSISRYAHAFPPPDCDEDFPGDCHFNNHFFWGPRDDPTIVLFDLQSVALHEIGHLLGLRHSDDENSIMFSGYRGERRELKGDALATIQRIYGARPPS